MRPRPSRRTGDPTTITFLNHTSEPVDVFWMDTEGHRQHYATVAAGSSWDSNTYDGHVWMVTGKDDRTLGVYEARTEASTAVVGDAPATQATSRPAAGAHVANPRRAQIRQTANGSLLSAITIFSFATKMGVRKFNSVRMGRRGILIRWGRFGGRRIQRK